MKRLEAVFGAAFGPAFQGWRAGAGGDGRLFVRTEKAGVSRDTPVDVLILIKPAPPGTV